MAKRDPYLDYLRGIAIVWVVVVHVLFLKEFVPAVSTGATIKRYILFEMPLIFFVSGAGLYFSSLRHSPILQYLWRRLRRLFIPYALVAIVCTVLFYRSQLAAGHPIDAGQAISWLLLRPWPVVPVYVGAYLWFMRVMLAFTVAHLVLVRLFSSERLRVPTAALLAVGIVGFSFVGKPVAEFYAVSLTQMPQYVVFYGAFGYLGYYYASGKLTRRPAWLLAAALGSFGLLAALAQLGLIQASAQANKFPPNLGYALFGAGWLAIWLLLRRPILAVANRLRVVGAGLRFYGTHSYSVYLFHGFGLWATDYALPYLHISDRLQGAHYGAWVAVYFVFTLGFTTLLTAVVGGAGSLLAGLAARARASGPGRAVETSRTTVGG